MDFTTYEPRISALEAGGGGGGGDSDFSAATVTFVNNTIVDGIDINIPSVYNDEFSSGFHLNKNNQSTREVVLYQGLSAGGSAIGFNGDYIETATVTGDIDWDEGSFEVSGDGTITF